MAYDKNNPDDVREVQEYLRRLSQEYTRIPELAVDGIYGEHTVEAVRVFQELFGLPVTGEVDSRTWQALSDEYERLVLPTIRPQEIFPFLRGGAVLVQGDTGPQVAILQAMLNTLAGVYCNLSTVPVTATFDPATEDAVKDMQCAFGVEQHGRVDRRTWELLAQMYNAHVGS